MPDGLYDRDILIWSEQQAALLRRLAAGERLNEGLDWDNLIDEVESVGLSELHRCESMLVIALVHLLKLRAIPDSLSVRKWRGESLRFLADARRSFAPSMRQRIDLVELFRQALEQVLAVLRPTERIDLNLACPFALDDLLAGKPDIDQLVAMLDRTGT